MAGLVPAIRVLLADRTKQDVDARDKPGHDELYGHAASVFSTSLIQYEVP
jgi:hypothetical protein